MALPLSLALRLLSFLLPVWLTEPAHLLKKRPHTGMEENKKLSVVVQHTMALGIFL